MSIFKTIVMKSSVKIKFFSICISLIAIFLCSWRLTPIKAAPAKKMAIIENGVVVENGVLVFTSEEAFERTVKEMKYNLNAIIASLQNQGFTSMQQAYNAITEAEQQAISARGENSGYEDILRLVSDDEEIGSLVAEPNAPGDILPNIINQRGLVVIAGKAYKYTMNKVFKTSYSNINLLTSTSIEALETTIGVETFLILKKCVGEKICHSSTYENGKKRLKGQINAFSSYSYEEISSTVTHQKKVALIWWRDQTNRLEIVGNGTYKKDGIPIINPPCSNCPFSINNGNNNVGRFTHIVENWTTTAGAMNYCYVTNNTRHRGLCDDGVWRECAIVYP